MTVKSKALGRVKDVMWALAFAGLAAGIGRFVFGLGAATNMQDALPWGWWKVFNMVAGAALATSGFVVAAIIYILQLSRYRSVARLSVIVGFLGYGSSLAALLFDIGLPHRGWHPFFMWNPHSFLFEVFWCVSIYWGVTALELLPIITERLPFPKVTHWLHEKMLPFVVLGITLSTMHHSSLGSLFMASPTRLHPLWHSMWIPPEFFISAMGAGLSAIVLLLLTIGWLYGKQPDERAIRGLAKASAAFLALFLIVRAADFTVYDKWVFVFGSEVTWESWLFWLEVSLQAVIPVIILGIPALRNNRMLLTLATVAAVLGLIMHRIDTGIVGYFSSSNAVYLPNISELVVSFGVLSAAGLVFFFLIERFHVLDEPAHAHAHHDADDPYADDEHDVIAEDVITREEVRHILTGPNALRAARILLVAVPLTWISLDSQATGAFKPIPQPVSPALIATDALRTKFQLDANRNGMSTPFDHKKHQVDLQKVYGMTEEQTCAKCHHLNWPNDNNTSCRRCHTDMELPRSMFSLSRHENRFEKPEDRLAFDVIDLDNPREALAACMGCHEKKNVMVGMAAYARKGFVPQAPGYKNAMHGSCLTCHRLREKERKEDPANPESRGNCLFCHRDWANEGMFKKEATAAAPATDDEATASADGDRPNDGTNADVGAVGGEAAALTRDDR